MTTPPPTIAGVRRFFLAANGVQFHVTEAGPADGRPVLALHGWPQHHYEWRDLLADPPAGLRIIAPDLPGYGWSGPPSHRWAKDDVATDLLDLLAALRVDRVLLVAHDWGAYVGYRMMLRAPERFEGFLVMNMSHPWVPARTLLPNVWRLWYQVPLATFGRYLQQRTTLVERVLARWSDMDPQVARVFAERFRDPVCARAGRDTYRSFLTHDLPHSARIPEKREVTLPIRALHGFRDKAVAESLASPRTVRAVDYTLETVDASHFVVDERPDLVRVKLIALAGLTAPN